MILRIEGYPVGIIGTNCYLVTDEESGRRFVVDPGKWDGSLKRLLLNVKAGELDYILLTHGHFDHILGVSDVVKRYGGKIVIHENDSDCFENSERSLIRSMDVSEDLPEKADILVKDGDRLPFAGGFITVMHTPGHSEGSVCYLIENHVFSGDTLFCGSVGRTDFKYGSYDGIIRSVKRIAALDGNRKVYPGHGMLTTLERERKDNPYLKNENETDNY